MRFYYPAVTEPVEEKLANAAVSEEKKITSLADDNAVLQIKIPRFIRGFRVNCGNRIILGFFRKILVWILEKALSPDLVCYRKAKRKPSCKAGGFLLVTRTGIEPMLPP